MATYKEIQQNYRKIKCDDLIDMRTHIDQKHVSLSDADGINRLITEGKKAHSRFVLDKDAPNNIEANLKLMKQIIEEVLFSKEREMLAWIKYAPNDDQYKLTADYGEMVGIGLLKDKNGNIKEYSTDTITVLFKRNYAAKYGFTVVTAYPELNEPMVPLEKTNRDLTNEIRKTEKYNTASMLKKVYLEHMVNPNSNHNLKLFENVNGEEELILRVNMKRQAGIPDKYYNIRITENDLTLIAKQYNQLNHALGSERIETQLIKMAKEHDAMINNSVDLTNEYMKHQLEVKWPKLSMEIQQIQNSMEIIKHTELNRQLDELKMDEEELS